MAKPTIRVQLPAKTLEIPLAVGIEEWPTCYYVPEQLCGEKTFCECPSCPIRVGTKETIRLLRKDS